jgi:adenylylsulfate kinase
MSTAAAVLWFTGLSGAGKSAIANAVAERLAAAGGRVELLDGDIVRELSPAGFSREERISHVKRVGFLASRLEHHGVTVCCALISPYAESRSFVRALCSRFIEIHVSTPLSECERRDPKGLYRAARRGELSDFTGVDAPYEPPSSPDLELNTQLMSLEEAVQATLAVYTMSAQHTLQEAPMQSAEPRPDPLRD